MRAVGPQEAAALLGVPVTTINHWLSRDRYARISSNQKRLIDLVLKDVANAPTKELGAALRLIVHDLDRRGSARVLGIAVSTLDRWLQNPRSIPRQYHRIIFRIAANNLDVFRRRVAVKYREMVERGYDGTGGKVKSQAVFDQWIDAFVREKIAWENTRDERHWNRMMQAWRETGLYKAGVRMFGY